MATFCFLAMGTNEPMLLEETGVPSGSAASVFATSAAFAFDASAVAAFQAFVTKAPRLSSRAPPDIMPLLGRLRLLASTMYNCSFAKRSSSRCCLPGRGFLFLLRLRITHEITARAGGKRAY